MARDAYDWIKSLPADEQAAIQRRAAELEKEQAAFRDAQALGREALTQVADELGVSLGELDRMIAASDRYFEVLQERAAAMRELRPGSMSLRRILGALPALLRHSVRGRLR